MMHATFEIKPEATIGRITAQAIKNLSKKRIDIGTGSINLIIVALIVIFLILITKKRIAEKRRREAI